MHVSYRRALGEGLLLVGSILLLYTVALYFYAARCSWSLNHSTTRVALFADPQMEGDERARRDALGNFGNNMNDLYMKHIVTSICHLNPTHAVVLGDIFSFQRLLDEEFQSRVSRFQWIFSCLFERGILLINVTGNHDLGYGAELSRENLRRFESAFGPVNSKFEIGGHIFANINSLNLDSAKDATLRDESWAALQALDGSPLPVVLLTHIPLNKQNDFCSDKYSTRFDSHGFVTTQNFLSENTTRYIVDHIKPRFVFTGHDHEGCRHNHEGWTQEFTIRSLMGDFDGSVGLFEFALEDPITRTYRYHMGGCHFVPMKFITVTWVSWLIFTVLSLLVCLI